MNEPRFWIKHEASVDVDHYHLMESGGLLERPCIIESFSSLDDVEPWIAAWESDFRGWRAALESFKALHLPPEHQP